jgi:predicted anti-sigma-YlaC factor YlaD
VTEYYYQRHVEREILSALLDGELGSAERKFVHDHLQECEACREAAVEFGAVKGIVGDLPRLVAPESFVSRALARRRSRARSAASAAVRGRRRWVVAGVLATAVGVTLAGLVAPRPSSQPPIDVYVARHISVSDGIDDGGQVLFAVHPR